MLREKTIPSLHLAGLALVNLASLFAHCDVSGAADTPPSARRAIEQPAQSVTGSLQAVTALMQGTGPVAARMPDGDQAVYRGWLLVMRAIEPCRWLSIGSSPICGNAWLGGAG